MIPRVIHYCWFGKNPMPRLSRRCIDSWRRFMPDWEIREWNDRNFNLNLNAYIKHAYSAGKYAFVSDYARFWVLYHHGGVYFDTDVMLVKSFDELVAHGSFMGFEKNNDVLAVNPGLGMGAPCGVEFYGEMINLYDNHEVNPNDISPIEPIMIKYTTAKLLERGLILEDKQQCVAGINIYPNNYFNPLNDYDGRLNITPDTYSIHYYAKSWISGYGSLRSWLTRRYHRVLKAKKDSHV